MNSTKYNQARRAFMRKQGAWGWCSICDEPVDMSLSGRLGDGPTIDHIQPTSAGGSFFDQSNWALAHRRCNSAKGRGQAISRKIDGPTPGDPRFCWVRSFGEWMHVHPMHGVCEWPDCPNDWRDWK